MHVTVRNVGDTAGTLLDSLQKVVDADGRQYSASSMADVILSGGGQGTWLQSINPGNSVSGRIAFDMPSGAKAVRVEFHDSMISTGAVVALR